MSDRLNEWNNRGKRAQPNGLPDEALAKLQRTIRRERSRLRARLADPALRDETFDDTPEQLEPLNRKRPSCPYEVFLERMGGEPPDG